MRVYVYIYTYLYIRRVEIGRRRITHLYDIIPNYFALNIDLSNSSASDRTDPYRLVCSDAVIVYLHYKIFILCIRLCNKIGDILHLQFRYIYYNKFDVKFIISSSIIFARISINRILG